MAKIKKAFVAWEELERYALSGTGGSFYTKTEVDAMWEGYSGTKGQVAWANVTGKPGTFTPSAHAAEHQADGGDPLSNLLLGASPVINWQSGNLLLQTDEGTNANTYVDIKGKGTGEGWLRIYDEDNAEHLLLTSINNAGYIVTQGTSPGQLNFQDSVAQNIICWENIASGNPYFCIYGYKTGVGLKYFRTRVTTLGVAELDVQDVGALCYVGSQILSWGSTGVRMEDDKAYQFGSGGDYSLGYHLATDTLQIVDGYTLNTNIRAKLNASGQWFFSGSAFYIDSTWLTAHNKVKDSDKWNSYQMPALSDGKFLKSGAASISWADVHKLVASGFTLDTLIANNKVPDSQKWAGYLITDAPLPIKLDDLAEPEANTDLNVDLVKHGLFPKLSGHEAECYAGDGAWLRLYDSTSIIIKILCGVSDNLRNSNDTERTTAAGSYTKVKETKMDEPTGVMRIAFTLESVGGETVYGRIYKNGVAIGTAHSTTTVGTWDEDLGGFVLDDLIQIYAYAELEDTAKVRNMRFDYDRAIAMLGKCTLATPIAITTQDPFLMTNQDP